MAQQGLYVDHVNKFSNTEPDLYVVSVNAQKVFMSVKYVKNVQICQCDCR